MWIFQKTKAEPPSEPEREPEEWKNRAAFLERAVRNLVILTKDFTFELDELRTAFFKKQLDKFLDELPNEWRVRVLDDNLERCQMQIQDFSQRQTRYLEERETEFREIIDTLVSGLASAGAENEEFCKSMHSYSRTLEKVAKLDDIRQLKQALNQQVRFMNQEIEQKRERDAKTLNQLRKKISTLHLELKTAVKEGRACSLTRVGNRRAFDEALQSYYERCCLVWKPFGVILIDIDNFKQVNDVYGHKAGDLVLANLASALSQQVRSEDVVARYGGEEFAIILASTNLRGAKKCARKLVKLIDSLAFLTEEGEEIPVTISAGVAILNQQDDPESLVERADVALYAAKANGKNQAVCEGHMPKNRDRGVGRLAKNLLKNLKLA